MISYYNMNLQSRIKYNIGTYLYMYIVYIYKNISTIQKLHINDYNLPYNFQKTIIQMV